MKNINIDEVKITTAWFNTYDTQELHDHNGYPVGDFHPCFSLVYILNNPNNSNDTVYRLKQQPFLPHPSYLSGAKSPRPNRLRRLFPLLKNKLSI